MTDYTYTTGVPNPPNLPSQDVANMQINTNSIAGLISQDHIGFNVINGGYHLTIHQATVNSDPAAIPGPPAFGQIYSKNRTINLSTDAQLFYITPGNGISQLTGAHAAASGYQFIGDVCIQWGSGTVAKSPSETPFTFFTPFSAPPFTLTFGTEYTSATTSPTANPIFIEKNTITATGFSMINSSSGTPAKVYWMAIGTVA